MSVTHELDLRVTYGQKTYLARIVGTDPKFGFRREFVNSVGQNLSRSGKTGWKTYLVDEGQLYESNSGDGRKYWRGTADGAVEISRADLLAAL